MKNFHKMVTPPPLPYSGLFAHSPRYPVIHIEGLYRRLSVHANQQITICVNISGSARGPH